MCLGVYIISDHELPTVAKIRPAFQIVNVADAGLTWHFGHPLPSLQRQKLVWVNRMVEQFQGNQ